jgi:hypothetical protein
VEPLDVVLEALDPVESLVGRSRYAAEKISNQCI